MGFTPRRTTSSNFEVTTFPLGETVMTLTKMMAFWSQPSDWKPEGGLTFMLVWQDADGDEHTEFPSAPKSFGYNEKSTFWNRIAALAGKTAFDGDDFNEDGDLTSVSLELPGMENYRDGDPVAFFVKETLQDRQGNYYKDQNGKNIKVEIGVTHSDVSLVGKQCRLVMGEKRNQKGEVVEGNKVAQNGALPLATGASGKKKSGQAAPPAAPASAAAMP